MNVKSNKLKCYFHSIIIMTNWNRIRFMDSSPEIRIYSHKNSSSIGSGSHFASLLFIIIIIIEVYWNSILNFSIVN